MKLARVRFEDSVVAGCVDGDLVHPFAMERHPGAGEGSVQAALLTAAMTREPPASTGPAFPLAEAALLSPIPRPPSVRDFYAFEAHVATARRARGLEMDPDWFELPVFYFSNPASVIDPESTVRIPTSCAELDYELEVAAVVGVEASDVDATDWLDVIAGFCVMNDWSARDLQRREMRQGLGPGKGKDFALSLGPLLVTPDELPDVESGRPRAAMVARVNGAERSRGQLADIHHAWGDLVAHASRDTVLRPGDILGSGTVGTGCILELSLVDGPEREPWLAAGDKVELEVEGLGVLANRVGG